MSIVKVVVDVFLALSSKTACMGRVGFMRGRPCTASNSMNVFGKIEVYTKVLVSSFENVSECMGVCPTFQNYHTATKFSDLSAR